jgi:hypothetical protein
MSEPKVLSDSAIVLRGGRNRPEDIRRGIGQQFQIQIASLLAHPELEVPG